MKSTVMKLLLVALIGSPLLVQISARQEPAKLLSLDVTVLDEQGMRVDGLTKDDFALYEDQIKQQIQAVSQVQSPISLGLVLDSSGSMKEHVKMLNQALKGVLGALHTDDLIFAAQFKADPELLQDYTNDKQALVKAFGEVFFSSGTAMLDAVMATADYSHEKGKHRRRAILVITDGQDKNSAISEAKVREALLEDQVQVYFICMFGKAEIGTGASQKAKERMLRLAELSGGRAFFPVFDEEAATDATRIINDLHSQYLVSYQPSNQLVDGKLRTLSIAITPSNNRQLTVLTRKGYFGPGHISASEKDKQKETGKKSKQNKPE